LFSPSKFYVTKIRYRQFCRLLLPLLFAVYFQNSARAQSTPGIADEPEVSVAELVALALKNNPQPTIARANLEAARQRAGALKSLPNPILQIVPGFFGSETARDEEILLSQPLDVFGQRKAQRKVLEAEARALEAGSTLVTRALIVEVKNAAASLFAAQEAESLGEAQVEVAQAFLSAANRRAELGDIPPVQAQRAELELRRVENELTGARAERLVRRAVLNQLVGIAPETPLRVALPFNPALENLLRARGAALTFETQSTPAIGEAANITSGVLPTREAPLPASSQVGSEAIGTSIFSQRGSLLSHLVNRPDIVGAQATLEARRAQVDAIGKQRLPQVELQARRSSVFGSGDIALRAVITAPIFDFGSIKNEKRAAEAEVNAQEAQIALLKTQAASQVEQALVRLDQQRATVERYREGIVPQTLDLLRKTQLGFAAGASTYLEVLEAQRTLRAVQTEYLQALVGVRTSEASLESALGATPPESLLGVITNPQGGSTPPGVAAPGTIPGDIFPTVEQPPLNPPSSDLPSANANPSAMENSP
jgi:cobalt-zinc-cadmium efflux system outer membrane protein